MKTIVFAVLFAFLLGVGTAAASQPGKVSVMDHVRRDAPQLLHADAPRLTPRPGPKAGVAVGDQRSFWIWNLNVMPPADKQLPATCRAVGEHVLIYIADDQWVTAMAQADVDLALEIFESHTAATPDKGIYQNNVETFGVPSDIDGNGKVILFFYQVGSFNGIEFDGYFRNTDLQDAAGSNGGEVLHLDVDHKTDDYGLGVAAHEFVHLIEFKYDMNEEQWSSEASAQAAMVVNGYLSDLPGVADYFRHQDRQLTGWTQNNYPTIDYSELLLWAAFLHQTAPAGFYKALVSNTQNGIAALEAVLGGMGDQRGFGDLMADWAVMILMDSFAVPDMGFASFDVPQLPQQTRITAETDTEVTLGPRAIGYRTLNLAGFEGAKLTVNVTFDGPDQAAVRAAVWNPVGMVEIAYPERGAAETVLTVETAPPGADQARLALANPGAAALTFHVTYKWEAAPVDGDLDAGEDDFAGETDAPAEDVVEAETEAAVEGGQTDTTAADGDGALTAGDEDAQTEAAVPDGAGSSTGCSSTPGAGAAGLAAAMLILGLIIRRRRAVG